MTQLIAHITIVAFQVFMCLVSVLVISTLFNKFYKRRFYIERSGTIIRGTYCHPFMLTLVNYNLLILIVALFTLGLAFHFNW